MEAAELSSGSGGCGRGRAVSWEERALGAAARRLPLAVLRVAAARGPVLFPTPFPGDGATEGRVHPPPPLTWVPHSMAASAPPPPDKLEGGGGPAPPPAPPSTGRKQGKAGENAEEGWGLEKPRTWRPRRGAGVLRPRGLKKMGG